MIQSTVTMDPVAGSGSQSDLAPKTGRKKAVEFLNSDETLAAYFKDIKKIRSLSLAEELALAARIQTGDDQAVKILVEANLKFVVSVCRNYRYQGMPMADLISEGNLGLIRAARRFDGSMNFKFISYAVWWIRQGVLSALAEQSRVFNISAGKVGAMHRIGKSSRKLAQTLGRQPSMSEVAVEMKISEKEVDECHYLAVAPISLSRPAIGEENGCLEDNIADGEAPPTDETAREWVVARNMAKLLEPLPEREGQIIRLFYGIGHPRAMNLREIADRFQMTRERIRQIKQIALTRMRRPARIRQFAALRG